MIEVHSLQCLVDDQDNKPQSTPCETGRVCAYAIDDNEEPNKISRHCFLINDVPSVYEMGKCLKWFGGTFCPCDTDNCNSHCSADKCQIKDPVERQTKEKEERCVANCSATGGGPEKNDTTPTDSTTTNDTKTNPTDDNARVTSEDGPEPTEDGTGATSEDGPQPTEERSGATAEDAEETQKPTGTAFTTKENIRVVESNQFVFTNLMLATLVIRSFY